MKCACLLPLENILTISLYFIWPFVKTLHFLEIHDHHDEVNYGGVAEVAIMAKSWYLILIKTLKQSESAN